MSVKPKNADFWKLQTMKVYDILLSDSKGVQVVPDKV